ncbi:MAG: hypothetical protein LBQ76_08590 [Candidatus Fibromonas sp.]|jgi:hypothetical protein|nr:hypothetical protein [Candidatus Fibromonas sp.]
MKNKVVENVMSPRLKAIFGCVRDYDIALKEFNEISEIHKKRMTLETFKFLLRKEFYKSGLPKSKYGIDMPSLSASGLEKEFVIQIKAFQYNAEGKRFGEFRAKAHYLDKGIVVVFNGGYIDTNLSNSVEIDMERIAQFCHSGRVVRLANELKKTLTYPARYYYLFKRLHDIQKTLLMHLTGSIVLTGNLA